MNAGHWESAAELERKGTPFVVVTMTASRGHAPQDPGSKIIVTTAGLHHGTIGGGKIEAKCIIESKRILDLPRGESPTSMHTWNLQQDVGMTCGGEGTYLFERHESSAWSIVIFGAGHVAQALAHVLATLACRATLVDNRPEWLSRTPTGSGKIRTELVNEPSDYVANLRGDEFLIITTRGHATDIPVLKAIYTRQKEEGIHFPYIGGIASPVKAIKVRKELSDFGVRAEAIAEYRCPIGISLGTNDPAEIAISIAAELLQIRDRRTSSTVSASTGNRA